MSNVSDAGAPVAVTMSYDWEDGRPLSPPKQASLVVSPELAQVFARAADFNKRDTTPLSFTSLLVGLLTSSDPASNWLQEEFKRQHVSLERIAARKDQLNINGLDAAARSYMSLPVLAASKSAREVTEEGRGIAAALQTGSVFDVRHLVAAFPILRDWHEKDFEDLQIDRLSWCRAFGAQMADEYQLEKPYWRAYVDRAAPVPLTSFSADIYTNRDLLGIDRSVDALALLVASTRTDTPLSIGVFGPWGSGKTFFMRHLRKRIWSLAARNEKRIAAWDENRKIGKARPEDAPLYYGRVAQVEFNAWHYNEGNLVASLVDHIFRNLRVTPPNAEDKEFEKRQQDVLKEIARAKDGVGLAVQGIAQAQTEVDKAKVEVEEKRNDVKSACKLIDSKTQELLTLTGDASRARERLDAEIRGLAQTSTAVNPEALLSVAFQPLTDSQVFSDAKSAADAFAGTFRDWRKFATTLMSWKGLAVVALLAMAPFTAWLLEWLSAKFAVVMAGATTALTTLKPAIDEMKKRRVQFETKMAALEKEEKTLRERRKKELVEGQEKIKQEFEGKVTALRTTLENQRAELQQREASATAAVRTLAERTQELDAKVQERVKAELALQERETELQQVSNALLLDEFIKDRAGTDDYHKQLGFLALVRRDFERLSNLITKANEDWSSFEKKTEQPSINRIVLYIDDLDRCKVSTVLRVLEAVHLLLAFPLFVCVVAVDPRWIEECLHQRHPDLFGIRADDDGKPADDATVTVGDYLEKIFQIPIWMRPIDAKQRAAVVKSLLGSTAAPPPRHANAQGGWGHDEKTEPEPGSPRSAGADGFQAAVNKALERPDPLRITPEEAIFVDQVGELLSDKPRALKRFVNTYRLLKASLPDLDQQDFVREDASSPHKVCISQLAFFTGQPRLAPALVAELESLGSVLETDPRSVIGWFGTLPDKTRAPLQRTLDLIPDGHLMTLACFCEWLALTSTYLFHRDISVHAGGMSTPASTPARP